MHPKNISPQKGQAGLTLLEVLIAMVILVVGVLGWIGLQQTAVMNRGESRTMTVATELVQSKIEELSENPAGLCSDALCSGDDCESETIDGIEYTLEVSECSEVEENELSYADPLWIIEVKGKWDFQGDRELESRRVVNE